MHNYNIEQVLPHSHPMILLDTLNEYNDTSAYCSTTIRPESNFYQTKIQGVPAYVGIEYMAQTIAAYANANELDQGHGVSLGFLVSSRKYASKYAQFNLGDKLDIKVELIHKEDNGLSVFECIILHAEEEIITARINVFQPDEPEKYLAGQV